MKYIIAIIGLAIVIGLALLVSNDRKRVRYKPIALMLVIQLILSYLLLNTKFGLVLITAIANVFGKLLEYAGEGIEFVFGGMANEGQAPFFLTVLLPIVFVSVLIGILQHF
ncbi:MAG TPA: Na+ dependent nucleoside transporter N-terminal domain-containing protein, partial [Chondromyces sp.]|nr:Na+ dependent nucleoside transporter N-terminal domain-containing protein [Chondromyces sp.]